ncbi:MAG: acyltransferase [Oscillospiraceae bacterium]|nr:acyltransferase [Oscillospiraceae bacterium]
MDTAVSAPLRELNGKQQTFLDCFRIAAAFLVFVGHSLCFAGIPETVDASYYNAYAELGVIMFFMLSGFLAAYTLEKKNADHSYEFRRFAVHKLRRIMREYIPALLFIAALDAVSIKVLGPRYRYYDTYDLKTFLGNLLLIQWTVLNRLPGISVLAFGSAKPLWTLSVEWYFYLIHALLLLSIRNRRQLRLPELVVLALSLLLPIEYLVGGRGGGLGFVFALGVFGYYFFERLDRRMARLLLPACAVLTLVYVFLKVTAYSIYVFLLLWIALCSGLCLLDGQTRQGRRRFTAYLSGSSFMLYMLHFSILDFVFMSDALHSTGWKLVVGPLLTLGISFGMYSSFGRRKPFAALFPKRR